MKLLIVGAGIAGLTAAIALKRKGFQVELFEASPELKAVGAGIVLGGNALAVFEKLELVKKLQSKGSGIRKSKITDQDFQLIQGIANAVELLGIHRADLQGILLEAAKDIPLHFGKRFSRFEYMKNKQLRIHFEDGTSVVGDSLIGADGIHSKIRQQLFPKIICRPSGLACWRATLHYELPDTYKHQLIEAWGGKARFGFLTYCENEIYWFACYPLNKIDNPQKQTLAQLANLYDTFNPLVKALILATDEKAIHFDKLSDIPQKGQRWYNDQICLIGDAAHATTPNMGQGAGQAIEDAYCLAQAFGKYQTPKIAFSKFQAIRQKKVNHVIKTSRQVGQLAHWENTFVQKFRNRIFRMLPQSIAKKQMEDLIDISYMEKL